MELLKIDALWISEMCMKRWKCLALISDVKCGTFLFTKLYNADLGDIVLRLYPNNEVM